MFTVKVEYCDTTLTTMGRFASLAEAIKLADMLARQNTVSWVAVFAANGEIAYDTEGGAVTFS